MRWAEVEIETTAAAQEAVENIALENGCGGTASQGEAPVFVKCYLPVDDRLERRLSCIQSALESLPACGLEAGPAELTVKYVEDQDWADAWKQYFHATRVGKRIVVRPTWEEYEPATGEVVVELDPGMAFGTGSHPTTRMCLDALERYLRPRKKVVDFGTGSGILAIAAAKLGASIVIAFDFDETAVRVARENVRRNDQEERVEVHQADNLSFINTQVHLVTANVVAEIIIATARSLSGLLTRGGVLIASGIVDDKSLEVEQALRNQRFDIAEILKEDEWVTIVARRSG